MPYHDPKNLADLFNQGRLNRMMFYNGLIDCMPQFKPIDIVKVLSKEQLREFQEDLDGSRKIKSMDELVDWGVKRQWNLDQLKEFIAEVDAHCAKLPKDTSKGGHETATDSRSSPQSRAGPESK